VTKNSVLAVPAFTGDKETANIIAGLIMMLLSVIISFVLTLFLQKEMG